MDLAPLESQSVSRALSLLEASRRLVWVIGRTYFVVVVGARFPRSSLLAAVCRDLRWDVSFQTRDRTAAVKVLNPNHQATRDVCASSFLRDCQPLAVPGFWKPTRSLSGDPFFHLQSPQGGWSPRHVSVLFLLVDLAREGPLPAQAGDSMGPLCSGWSRPLSPSQCCALSHTCTVPSAT